MEEDLEAAILAGANDDDIEYIIMDHILINRDGNDIWRNQNLNIDQMTDEDILLNFRFERNHLPILKECLGLPDILLTEEGHNVDGLKALCILLKRLAYPCRLNDLAFFFGMLIQSLSQILKTTIAIIIEHRGPMLENLNNLPWLTREKLQQYSQIIANKGGAVHNCWGFIDGTARAICRPSVNQEDYYSGHKRQHCVKFQSVLCPDGIIVSLKGAFPGRRHDAGIFRDSELYAELEQKAVFGEEEKYVLYGDQGYGIMELLITPYPGQPENMPIHHHLFNQSMKTLRVAVEWGFSKVVQQFAFVDLKKNRNCCFKTLKLFTKLQFC